MATTENRHRLMYSALIWLSCVGLPCTFSSGILIPEFDNQMVSDNSMKRDGQRSKLHTYLGGVVYANPRAPGKTTFLDGVEVNVASLIPSDIDRVSVNLGSGILSKIAASVKPLKLPDDNSDHRDALKATLLTRIHCADCQSDQPSKLEQLTPTNDMSKAREKPQSLNVVFKEGPHQSISTNWPSIDEQLTENVFPQTRQPDIPRLAKELIIFHSMFSLPREKNYIRPWERVPLSPTLGPKTALANSNMVGSNHAEIANTPDVLESDKSGNSDFATKRSFLFSLLGSTNRHINKSIPRTNLVIAKTLNEDSKQSVAITSTRYSAVSFRSPPLAPLADSQTRYFPYKLVKNYSRYLLKNRGALKSKITLLPGKTRKSRQRRPNDIRLRLEQIVNGYLAGNWFSAEETSPSGYSSRSTRFSTLANGNDKQNENYLYRKKRDTFDGDFAPKKRDRDDHRDQPIVHENSADGSGETQSTSRNQWSPGFSLRSEGIIGLVNPSREKPRFDGGGFKASILPAALLEDPQSTEKVFDNQTTTNHTSQEKDSFTEIDSSANNTKDVHNGMDGDHASKDKDDFDPNGTPIDPEPLPEGEMVNNTSTNLLINAGPGHNKTKGGHFSRNITSDASYPEPNSEPEPEGGVSEGHTTHTQASLPEPEPEPEPLPEVEPRPTGETGDCDELSCNAYAEPTPNWEEAKETWQAAWEIHVYGAGIVFAILSLYSLISVIGLVRKRDLISQGYFISLNLMLLIMCSTRAVYFLVDGYNSRLTFPPVIAYFLYSISFPCMTSAFSILFLALLSTLKMQLLSPRIQKPQTLVGIISFHFILSIVTDVVIAYFANPKIMIVVCECFFVFWGMVLFLTYIYVFRKLYVAAMNRHKEMLRLTTSQPKLVCSEELPTKRPSRPVFNAAVKVTLATAILGLFLAGLEVYALIGVFNVVYQGVPEPWPWFGFHFGARIIEIGMCVTMSYVATQPFRYHISPKRRKGQISLLDIIYFVPCHIYCNESVKDQYMSAPTDCSYTQPMADNPACGYVNEYVCKTTSACSTGFSLGDEENIEENKANESFKTKSLESNGDKKRKSMLVKEEGFVRFRHEGDPEGDFIVSTDDELGSNDGVLSNGSASGVGPGLDLHARNHAYYLANGTTINSTRPFHSVPNTGENTPATPRSLCSTDLELDTTGSMFSFRPPSSIHLRDSIEGALNYNYGPRFTLKTPDYLDTPDSMSLPRTPDDLDIEDYHSARSGTPNSKECGFDRSPRNQGSRLSTRSAGDVKTTWFHKSPKNYWRAISQVKAMNSNLSLASSRHSPLDNTALD